MKTIRELILSNKTWSAEMRERKKDYFAQQTSGQSPEIMWIGGSDSRVSPQHITQTRPGELFIHRNLANLVYQDDDNLMADLQHAIEDFKVAHIILCGHYGCSGLQTAMTDGGSGHVRSWLLAAREVFAMHRAELEAIDDRVQRQDRMAELNVREQLVRLANTDTVRSAFERGQDLTLHGWVYDLRSGLLAELLEIDPTGQLSEIAVQDLEEKAKRKAGGHAALSPPALMAQV
ncbi:carbonic anhydrase [Qipengyuania qiaonensis]|uniref:carbonic anhydrase n=1 Tax=Qipengyuania qiaonensis TaxID=2867240 RepID=A0ABS7JBZ2_9SPHN|nr:carbonic anhydrase [Qipengyuania qiaonensis]MBX7483359.1 carbonic anhydrase [Qipengyuania qiaonensis]